MTWADVSCYGCIRVDQACMSNHFALVEGLGLNSRFAGLRYGKMVARCLAGAYHYVGGMHPSCGGELVGRQIQCLAVNSCAAYLGVACVDDACAHETLVGVSPCQYHRRHHPLYRLFLESLQVLCAHVEFHTI